MAVESDQGGRLREELALVERPVPALSRKRADALTERQREVLDRLQVIFDSGFADLTMASIAARSGCSLRLLYQIAPSRDDLVATVVDRNLWAVGRAAMDRAARVDDPIDALRGYLYAATEAVRTTTPEFARDIRRIPSAFERNRSHERYLIAITTRLLDIAVDDGTIRPIDTAALARVLAGLGGLFASAEEIDAIRSTPKEAADSIVDLILTGLLSMGE